MNSPTSSVVAGDRDAVTSFESRLTVEGIRCKVVNAEYAFHSAQVEAHAAQLAAELAGLNASVPSLAWVSTVSGRAMLEPCAPAYWRRNMREPVRFADAVATLLGDDRRVFVEIGPHPVLMSMIAACGAAAGPVPVEAVPTLRRGQPERHAMLTAIGRVYELGFDVNWSVQGSGRTVTLPSYPWDRHVRWIHSMRVRHDRRTDTAPVNGDLCYEIQWQPRARIASSVPRRSLEYIADPGDLAKRLEAWRGRFDETPAATNAELERICRLFGVDALRTLASASGNRIDRAALARATSSSHAGLLAAIVGHLEAAGWLTQDGDGWRDSAPADDPRLLLDRLIASDSSSAAIARLVGACAPRLAEILRGTLDPVALLSSDQAQAVDSVLDEAVFARSGSELLQQAVAAVVENVPADRVVRVLEIGGLVRSPATPLELLPRGRSEYVFAAASAEALQRARRRFGAQTFARFMTLDFERTLADQGVGAGQFDVIVASYALHASRDLSAVLQTLRHLLVPGGVLIALEPAERRTWFELTLGLGNRSSIAADDGREDRVLSAGEWREALLERGLNGCDPVDVSKAPERSLLPQRLLLARANHQTRDAAAPFPERRSQDAPTTWCVFADTNGVAEALRLRVSLRGARVVMVSKGTAFSVNGDRIEIRPGETADYDSLLASLTLEQGGQLRIVDLWPLDVQDEQAAAADWDAVESVVCGPVLNLVAALRRTARPASEIWLVTRGVHAAGGASVSLAQSPLWGIGRVLALEHPEYWGGLLDLDGARGAEDNAASLLREIEESDGEDQIALRDDERFVPRLVRTGPPARQKPGLRRDRAYFVTGGVGGLGLQLAQWMVSAGAGWLVLGSRRGTAGLSADAQRAVREMERSGAVVEVVPVDVAEVSSLRTVFDSFGRERPRLGGIVHAAGVIEMHSIESLPPEALRRVLRPKVAGAWNLHALSASLPLDFFVLFSSAASVWGSAGMAHYSAANHFLDTLASVRQRAGLPVTCFNWGWWEGGASTEEHHRYYAQIGLDRLRRDEALSAFASGIASGGTATTVARVDWPRFAAVYQARRSRPLLEYVAAEQEVTGSDGRGASATPLVDRLRQAPADQVMALLAAHIRGEVASVIGLASAEVQDTDGFFDLGMDSITTVELRSRLQQALGCALPVTVAFEYPTVLALAAFLARELGLVTAAPVTPPSSADSAAQTPVDDFSKQSLDELAALLDDSIAEVMGVDAGKERG